MISIVLKRVFAGSALILGLFVMGVSGVNPQGESVLVLKGQSATLLPDGQWLLIGGESANGTLRTAAIWNPTSGIVTTFSAQLRNARSAHTATLLPDGTVFVFGGIGADGRAVTQAEFFDSETSSFILPPSSLDLSPRSRHTATLLTDGGVLIAGGLSADGTALDRAELWNFSNGKSVLLNTRLNAPRYNHTATLLADGKVLLAGGFDKDGAPLDDGDLFDPATQGFTRFSSAEIQNLKSQSQNPLLVASLPANGSSDVAVDSLIAVRFSVAMRVETVNTDTVVLSGPNGAEQVELVPAENGMLAFITALDGLLPGATYSVTLNGVVDRNGFPLPVSGFSFTTEGSAGASPQSGTTSSSSSGKPQAQAKAEPVSAQSDGWDWSGEWRDGKPHSPWQDLPVLQAAAGVTALAGQVLDLTGQPLANVTLEIEYDSGDVTASTDSTGRFLLGNLTPGWREIVIDGRHAQRRVSAESSSLTPPDNYGLFEYRVEIKNGTTNILPFTIWLPKIDTAHAVQIPSPTIAEVVLTTPHMPNFELHIAAGTTIYDYEGNIATEVSITPIPQDRTPFPLPDGMMFPVYTTIQPGGAYLYGSRGAWIVYPNKTDSPPGSRADLWHYDPEERGWYIYGQGTVTDDGTQIVPDPGVSFYSFTGAGATLTNKNPPAIGPKPGGSVKDGEPVDLGTGLFVLEKTDMFLADVLPIAFTRTYRTLDTVSRPFGKGATHNYEIVLSGAGGTDFSFVDLILPDGGKVHYDRISPGTGFADAVFEHTATPSVYFKTQITFNSGTSRWELKLKDGTVYVFGPHSGLRLALKDRNGNQLTITRTAGENGNISTITSPNGRFLQFSYDTSNRITQIADNSGRTVGYTYDSNGRISKVTDPNSGATNYTYDSSHRMTTIKDPRAIVFLTNTYDANGRVSKQTQKDATTFLFAYTLDVNGKVIQTDVTDPRTNKRRVTFNADGYTLTDTRALGKPEEQTETYEREAGSNLVLSVTDPLNRKTSYAYNALGMVTSLTRLADTVDAVTSTFTYEPSFNQLQTITDPLSHSTSFAYDTQGNLLTITNPLNKTTTLTRNGAGQPLSISDPLNNTTLFTYSSGNLISITDPNGIIINRTFDTVARLSTVNDPAGNITQYVYDPLNRITQLMDALNGITAFTYDPNGNLLTLKDARLKTTTYTYDNMDRLATHKDPLTNSDSYLYDANGNLSQLTDRKPQITGYTYDALNRLTQITYAGPSTTNYTFDNGNRLTQVVDSIAGTITRSYDGLDRLTSETTPQGSAIFTYDTANRRTSMTASGQSTVNYSYDEGNRLTQVSQDTSTVSFTYDDASRRSSLTIPNGIVVEYTYDRGSRLKELKYKNGVVELGNLLYLYDKAGNRNKVAGTFARTGMPQAVASATYNNGNRQTAFGGKTMVFDKNGNLTSLADTSGTTIYTWNSRNQPTGISGPGVNASFVYDGLGRREQKTINGSLTELLYDILNPVQETSGATIKANILGGLGIDEYFTRNDIASSTSYILPDAIGSVLALSDNSGTVQTEYTYDPFGNSTFSGASDTNPFEFTGRENDTTGLKYYRARYYNPQLQRFISEDPLGFGGGDANLYSYVFNDPIRRIDPSGLWAGWDDLAFAGGGALVGITAQGLGDYNSGKISGWEDYVGAAIGGAVGGEALLYMGPVVAGAAGGAASNLAKQGLKNLSGRKCGLDAMSLLVDTSVGALSGSMTGLGIPGISAGRNSFNAIYGQMATKFRTGQISSLRLQTGVKMAIGRFENAGVVKGTAVGVLAAGITSGLLPVGGQCPIN
jgi:RHS repeat-associated protein